MFGVAPLKAREYVSAADLHQPLQQDPRWPPQTAVPTLALSSSIILKPPAADAVHRRFDRDDEGVLDPGESLIDRRQNGLGRAPSNHVPERRN
jgi:hypothetical protein